MEKSLYGTFVSEKISKIRWQHENFTDAKNCITGSWDDSVNHLSHWTFQCDAEEDGSDPVLTFSQPFSGDVTELEFITREIFVASSSLGHVKVFEVRENPHVQFKELISWNGLHKFSTSETASCTSFSTFEQDIATVGEDGNLNLLMAQQKTPARVVENADSCSIYCVDFLKHNEVITGNSRGNMKIWDLRSDQDTPVMSFMLSNRAQTEATAVAHHPTQRHTLVVGGGDGCLTVWDLRRQTYPVSQLSAHAKAVSEIVFHKDRPENLFTCSASGELWHWNNSQPTKLKLADSNADSHWLNLIGTKEKVAVTSLWEPMHKPINSLDVDRSTVIFGCDNEAMYVVKNIEV